MNICRQCIFFFCLKLGILPVHPPQAQPSLSSLILSTSHLVYSETLSTLRIWCNTLMLILLHSLDSRMRLQSAENCPQ